MINHDKNPSVPVLSPHIREGEFEMFRVDDGNSVGYFRFILLIALNR
jgi:hypothetical protein